MRIEKGILLALCEFGWRYKLFTSGSQLNSKPKPVFRGQGFSIRSRFPRQTSFQWGGIRTIILHQPSFPSL
jgi:hypothetical protein